jgi:hypothetical protein
MRTQYDPELLYPRVNRDHTRVNFTSRPIIFESTYHRLSISLCEARAYALVKLILRTLITTRNALHSFQTRIGLVRSWNPQTCKGLILVMSCSKASQQLNYD